MFEFPAQSLGTESGVNVLRRAMATMQHHDAVTGTTTIFVLTNFVLKI
jgi:hypothetical protein